METVLIIEIIRAVFRELVALKGWIFAVFVIVAFSILTVGKFWEEQYQTSTTLYADVTNIITPLLKGRAESTGIDRSKEASEKIYTRKIMKRVAESSGLIQPDDEVEVQEQAINGLRGAVKIQNVGQNSFKVTYGNSDQNKSFKILNAVVDAFISDSSESKRRESRSAFEFIEQQVITYKRQLVSAEEKLKTFKSTNLDGTEGAVANRIESLRLQIEEMKLTIDESQAQVAALEEQLKDEGKYVSVRNELDGELDRLKMLNARLDALRLSYQESYPDIVELRDQLAALELSVSAKREQGNIRGYSSGNSLENPLYEELRKNMSAAELGLRSQKKRLESMNRMLKQEYARAERVAGREADLSELVRDYNVTREIYEEMLGRKEKARLSMTLDLEGQGVSYKIQEPAVFPLQPSGLRFEYFAMAGPIVGILASLGLIIIYVLLDPRVRSPSSLMQKLPPDIELLVVVPHINTPITKRILRADIAMLGFMLVVAVAAYVVAVGAVLRGLI
ncbi:MAG: polysaccharide chain length determinant protein (PEP-CTERM system associated) [Oceanicoccus sp.]|jgi:polysaccharide chain length determinant protein (PEP-CTERM system associated)